MLGENTPTADKSLNSLPNSSPLIKCFIVTPNISGLKIS